MQVDPGELQRREIAARAAIKEAVGRADEDYGAATFVSHHLKELDAVYWLKHLSTATPEPGAVVDLLILKSIWGDEDELNNFDFTLPEHVTNYMICVNFDESGEISKIALES